MRYSVAPRSHFVLLVIATGFEPVTVPIKIGMLYPFYVIIRKDFTNLLIVCDRDRIRTCDRLLRRQMLYPAELRDHIILFQL